MPKRRPSGYAKPGNWLTLKAAVLARDGHACQTCGATASTADHIVPVAHGGTHHMSNLAAICKPCHDDKTERERVEGIRAWRRKQSRLREPEQHPGKRKPHAQ